MDCYIQAISAGRGGAGNIRSLSQQAAFENRARSTSQSAVRAISEAYERDVLARRLVESHNEVVSRCRTLLLLFC